jgi:hypothetical protein
VPDPFLLRFFAPVQRLVARIIRSSWAAEHARPNASSSASFSGVAARVSALTLLNDN